MYTQCPDCSTAFRVTAGILKQAAGKVRCGGCGCAFNALEYLSEAMPEAPAARESEVPVPELTPEPVQSDESVPQSISAEQSAALLKTLDDLAGSDIRIEDTGVEWRVLDIDEAAEDREDPEDPRPGENGYIVDELLDESPTPVDQFLTKTPNDIDASEVFEESANAPAQTPVDELRFDDNTPLPDEFNLDDEASYLPESPEPGETDDAGMDETDLADEPALDTDETPVDIALGEPDEWADILDEFSEPPEPYVPPLDAELAALEETESGEAGDGEPPALDESDQPLDVDTQFALQAEAMGIDLSGVHARSADEAEAQEVDDVEEPAPQDRSDEAGEALEAEAAEPVDLDDGDETGESPALGLDDETGEPIPPDGPGERKAEVAEDSSSLEVPDEEADTDIRDLDEIDEALEDVAAEASDLDDEETGEAPHLRLDDEMDEAFEAESAEASDLEGDDETGEALEAEAAGFDEEDETGEAPHLQLDDVTDEVLEAESAEASDPEGDEMDEAPEAKASDRDDEEETGEATAMEADVATEAIASGDDGEHSPLEFGSVEKAMAELEEQSDVFGDDFFEQAAVEEGESEGQPDDDVGVTFSDSADTGHFVPPQTEEEQTLNLLIDRELLSIAVEDEDGFSSTMVIPEERVESKTVSEKIKPANADDESSGFESIVMEGEVVRSGLDQEQRKADIAEARALAEQAKAAAEEKEPTSERRSNRRMMAAAVLLALMLVVQAVHQSREALATIPALNDVIGPVYRAIGKPLSPTWDVTGWRFEARRDAFDDAANRLTIISRIGNTSDKALPYPLINVTLTDRFEETIGNRTLDPGEYLSDDLDPRTLVQPGNNFTAVMSIEGPSEAATGYKLQACYRLPDAHLRCHIPGFK